MREALLRFGVTLVLTAGASAILLYFTEPPAPPVSQQLADPT
jgi:hypothetical protein